LHRSTSISLDHLMGTADLFARQASELLTCPPSLT